jgi:periplasmic divalent cation tolerance protein
MNEDLVVVYTTAGSEEQAHAIATTIVEERLAACVNIVAGVKSVYRWRGKIERDTEHLLIIKSAALRFDALRERIRALHSYELPEIIAVRIAAGDPDVLAWIFAGASPADEADSRP